MRRLIVFLVVGLLGAACGDSADTTTTTLAPEATTATTQPPATSQPPATTQAPTTTAAPTVTFTGSECIYSGPDTFSAGEIVRFTVRNESRVVVVVVTLELLGSTLEDLVADDVRIFPPIEAWPPPPGTVFVPEELISFWRIDPGTETSNHSALFTRAGDHGTACWPADGNPAVQGALLTVEE